MSLLFTVKQDDYEKLVLNENISVIGYMTGSGGREKIINERRK